MRTFNVYLTARWNYAKKVWVFDAHAEPPDSKTISEFYQLLFTCPEKWLPEDKQSFLNACAYYKQEVPANVNWYGYVPF
jgi:hypothetical protein